MGIKIEEGKTYRNKKGHLIFVKQQISDSQFLCVREVRGFCQLEVFDLTGKPSQTARVAMDFFISEEVPTGETVSDKDRSA